MVELSPVAKAALGQLLSAVGTQAREWFRKTAVERAADRLVGTHRHGQDLKRALAAWFTKPQFKTALFKIQQGGGEVDRNALADALIDAGFGLGDETPRVAVEIVDAFLAALEEELLRSSDGILYSHQVQMEELRSQSADHRAGVEGVRLEVQKTSQGVATIHALLEDAHGATDELNRRIDAARDQLVAGKISTARELLLRIQEETSGRPLSDEIRQRVFTNLACCELQLGRPTEAADLFETAYRLRPTDSKAQANRALALRLRGDEQGARQLIDSVLAAHPKNRGAISVLADLLERQGDRAAAIRTLEEHSGDDAGLKERLAELYLRDDQAQRALDVLAQLVGVPEASAIVLRSEIELRIAERYFKDENPLPWQLPQDLRNRLEAAERNLSGVIDRGRGEWPALHKAARTLRGYLRAFLFRHGDACDDLSAVAAEGDVDTNVLVNLAVFRIINDQPADALAAAEQAVRQDDGDVQAWLILADAAGFAGNWDKSLTAANEALRRAAGDHRERAYAATAEALRRLKRFDEAASFLDTGLAETPSSDELLSMRALVLLDRGEVDEAIAVSRDAIVQAPGGRRYLATIRAADLAFRGRRFADAANLYREIVNPSVVTETLQRFTISLYETGAFDEALTLGRNAREGRSPIETISEVEGAILERLGRLEDAAQLYEGMVSAEVRPIRAMERLAVVYHRLGRPDDVRRVVEKLIPRAEDDAHALMMVAHLLVTTGEIKRALPIAYRALGLGQKRSDLHLAYVGVVHAIPDTQVADFTPEVAGIDAAVSIEIDGETATYVIVADGTPYNWPDEIAATSGMATALVGKRAGDTVPLPPTPLGPRTGTIRAVQHKYVARFQSVLTEFNRRFPEAAGLWKLKVDDDLANVKALLDARAERIKMAIAAYEERKLTVGLLAQMVQRSGLETWRTLLANAEFRPFVRPGHHESLLEAFEILKAADAVVLDLTSAVTLFGLDLLEQITQYHRQIRVPQSVIDALSEEIDKHRIMDAGRPTLVTFKRGDVYYREEITSEQTRELVETFERLRDQLRRLPIAARPGSSPIYSNPQVADALSPEFADAVAIARETAAVLVSDDVFLKELAANEWGVRGVSTFDLVAYAVTQGQASSEVLESATIRMIRWKCRGVPIRVATIVLALQRGGYDVDDDVAALLEVLADVETEAASAVRVAVGVLRDLWLSSVLPHKLLTVTDALLEALVRDRGPDVLEHVNAEAAAAMRLVPQYERTLRRAIEEFKRRRYRGEIIP
jgi:tetratricopeptide (TPR) repeat protein